MTNDSLTRCAVYGIVVTWKKCINNNNILGGTKMRIQKTTSAVIEVNSEELQALLDMCEIVRRCMDQDRPSEAIEDYGGDRVGQMRMFIRSIGSRDQYE